MARETNFQIKKDTTLRPTNMEPLREILEDTCPVVINRTCMAGEVSRSCLTNTRSFRSKPTDMISIRRLPQHTTRMAPAPSNKHSPSWPEQVPPLNLGNSKKKRDHAKGDSRSAVRATTKTSFRYLFGVPVFPTGDISKMVLLQNPPVH